MAFELDPARGAMDLDAPRPSALGRFGHVSATIAAVIVIAVTGMMFAVSESMAPGAPALDPAWAMLGFLTALGCGVSMIWRKRAPWLIFLINAGCALLLPLDPFGTLLALTWVLSVAPARRSRWAVAIASAVTVVAFGRDWNREVAGTLMKMSDPVSDQAQVLTGAGYIIVIVLVVAVSVGIGFARRYRNRAAIATHEAVASEEIAARLRGTLDRQEERDLIAREMHDTVAHELSVISLHSAALEVSVADPEVKESAQAVRHSVQRALGELRSMIGSLRDSADDGYAGTTPEFTSIADLVEEAKKAGVAVQAIINVRDSQYAAAALVRATYRIVQESLTNAMRYAPDSAVTLSVTGDPMNGIHIVAASWLAPTPRGTGGGSPGAGLGLRGMRERATALGGTLYAGVEHSMWVVRAYLPWSGVEIPTAAPYTTQQQPELRRESWPGY